MIIASKAVLATMIRGVHDATRHEYKCWQELGSDSPALFCPFLISWGGARLSKLRGQGSQKAWKFNGEGIDLDRPCADLYYLLVMIAVRSCLTTK
eukprot:6293401-Amphidinium_carterae.1